MATLYQRGKTWWVDYRTGGRRVQRSLKTSQKRVAEEALKVIDGDLVRGKLGIVTRDLALEDAVQRFLADRQVRVVNRWQVRLKQILSAFQADIGVKRLKDLTPEILGHWVRDQERKRTGHGAGRQFQVVRTFLRWCKRTGYLTENPIDRVDPPRKPEKKPIEFLTREEFEKLLAACQAPVIGGQGAERPRGTPLAAMVAVAGFAGLRASEMLNLTWACVDLDRRTLKIIKAKDREPRSIAIPPRLASILREHQAAEETGFLFRTREGNAYQLGNASRELRSAGKRAKLKKPVGWNLLRHSYASWLRQAGQPLEHISKLLGHASYTTTERYYAEVETEKLHHVVDVLG